MPIKINYEKCCWKNGKCTSCSCSCSGSCEGCVEVCPAGALKRKKSVVLDSKKCTECGACVSACKHHAISLS